MSKFTFINHACYFIETKKSILLVDPWIEGYAFDRGWSLLDKSTSNQKLIDYLFNKNKKVFIWLSHEHSDHFSVPFVNELKKYEIDVKFFFQKTLDGRVASFIKKLGFNIIESNDKVEFIDSELSIITFPFEGGDSYSLTLWREYSILNINDCVISNQVAAKKVINNFKKYTNKIDLLLTQFGYANWLGNKDEKQQRVSSASEKLNRIKLQIEKFNPRFIIPFASFIYFCHPENFHINDSQNLPLDVDNLFKKNNFNGDLIIVKSMDKLDLSLDLTAQNQNLKNYNIEYWKKLRNQIKIDILKEVKFSNEEIILEYKKFRKKIFKSFFTLPFILEKLKFLNPIKLYLHDLDVNFNLSYINKLKIETGNKTNADISLSSATLMFILKNEYGSNTISVNGKFERISSNGAQKLYRHFSPQEYMKMGYGLDHPVTSLVILFGKLIHKLRNKKWDINPSLDS